MFFSVTFVSLLAAAATLVSGASVKRQSVDNSCSQLQTTCANNVQNNLQNVWSIESCLFAGVCFERNGTTLDDFTRVLWQRKGQSGNPPASVNLPRVTQGVSSVLPVNFIVYRLCI